MLFNIVAVLAAASVSLAATPQGFKPASETPLLVSFSGIDASGGKIVAKEASQAQPQLATSSRLTGTSFAVLMIDLDIPTNSPPATNTLLHWMQTGLTQSSSATLLNTTAGRSNAFALQMPGAVAAAASYFGPSPPARVPLSHRYTELLIDTSAASQESMSVLMQAAQSRQGFNAEQVLTKAGLANKIVAGNFFNVTNPGPVQNVATGNSTGGSGSARGTGTTNGPNQTTAPIRGSAVLQKTNSLLLGATVAGAALLIL
ncbi:hypothetical protein JX265_004001 [Neoarthrinium moseri]|uniref:PEBP-like protein n=1 Tax=Neoarthrinium moseri TaxID=1658444 RepID=A0A9Q0ARH9_9PEZI|nr:uncharacterized protein JN550_006754 [Neoarthrinium moseri]KAI1853665.1 hypothetical protein JX266_001649 [Neoarthrinium moseri]KAI1867947.1 hypothetical protein JN550_006754 [Neoarthrinium moseri]KAI1876475.1 hypothetical protein JX265_004001 [Neoarthrinium moseri]